ncbi:Dol-p-man:man(5)glcnac(2)-pp-dol alpha-1,3-mannosyltransferase [Plakobranchus ocellatus]|uniref:dolichyl-P-Man:Man5GlcNAc2-PP-dolichol alpha-1,3-mannosyltransferase n=1 Tax=Plakobranchus ocellatus TaxID=259542 RepID=A0AAV3YI72_9GAST|nr:Dol-p-man:man(5)glcnac(2)-pp-dol alpha-1,3-mannosyltransferase [Plakobranchus ocellatus]
MTLPQKDSRVNLAAARKTLESTWRPPKPLFSLPGGRQKYLRLCLAAAKSRIRLAAAKNTARPPFSLANPVGYVVSSFDQERQFFYVWTVNWRLIAEEIFLNLVFQVSLLVAHILILILFFWCRWRQMFVNAKLQWSKSGLKQKLGPHHILHFVLPYVKL